MVMQALEFFTFAKDSTKIAKWSELEEAHMISTTTIHGNHWKTIHSFCQSNKYGHPLFPVFWAILDQSRKFKLVQTSLLNYEIVRKGSAETSTWELVGKCRLAIHRKWIWIGLLSSDTVRFPLNRKRQKVTSFWIDPF